MAPKKVDEKAGKSKTLLVVNKGAWTAEEDRKLSDFIQLHGAKKWKTVALKAGLSRCGKSCRLRWLNYLRPNIKRGNISEEEEDLILRLQKLLGNRWSLIAGRLPGRTDNEIKNYWNSHLSKKVDEKGIKIEIPAPPFVMPPEEDGSHSSAIEEEEEREDHMVENEEDTEISFDMNELFDFSTEGTYGLNWVDKFLALDEDSNNSLDEKR